MITYDKHHYMKVFQMQRFKKYAKKLPRHLQQIILDAVEDTLTDTEIGEHNALRANFIKTLTGLIPLTAGDNVHVNHEIKSYERKYY